MTIIGTCSQCGGDVARIDHYFGTGPMPPATCQRCGATEVRSVRQRVIQTERQPGCSPATSRIMEMMREHKGDAGPALAAPSHRAGRSTRAKATRPARYMAPACSNMRPGPGQPLHLQDGPEDPPGMFPGALDKAGRGR